MQNSFCQRKEHLPQMLNPEIYARSPEPQIMSKQRSAETPYTPPRYETLCKILYQTLNPKP